MFVKSVNQPNQLIMLHKLQEIQQMKRQHRVKKGVNVIFLLRKFTIAA
jgi:hypothetical protein